MQATRTHALSGRLWPPVERKLTKKLGIRMDDATGRHAAVCDFAHKLGMTDSAASRVDQRGRVLVSHRHRLAVIGRRNPNRNECSVLFRH
jgi:hypothetical protein